jgi:predicted chitinase
MASNSVLSTMLLASGIAPCVTALFVPLLRQACGRFGIRTPARLAAFVSHCAFESRGFVALEQSLHYRTPERIHAMWPERVPDMDEADQLIGAPELLANTVYAGRYGNGDAASGDGWRYRGRGLIRLLGRAAYRAAGAGLLGGGLAVASARTQRARRRAPDRRHRTPRARAEVAGPARTQVALPRRAGDLAGHGPHGRRTRWDPVAGAPGAWRPRRGQSRPHGGQARRASRTFRSLKSPGHRRVAHALPNAGSPGPRHRLAMTTTNEEDFFDVRHCR